MCMRLVRDKRGDVMLEYVLIMTLIILPLVSGSEILFNPSGVDDAGKRDFGTFGNAFVEFYQRLVCGIGLPIP